METYLVYYDYIQENGVWSYNNEFIWYSDEKASHTEAEKYTLNKFKHLKGIRVQKVIYC